jgi:hypothetical protein
MKIPEIVNNCVSIARVLIKKGSNIWSVSHTFSLYLLVLVVFINFLSNHDYVLQLDLQP